MTGARSGGRHDMRRNVTTWRAGIGSVFTVASTRCTILPGDDNYHANLNAGIMFD